MGEAGSVADLSANNTGLNYAFGTNRWPGVLAQSGRKASCRAETYGNSCYQGLFLYFYPTNSRFFFAPIIIAWCQYCIICRPVKAVYALLFTSKLFSIKTTIAPHPISVLIQINKNTLLLMLLLASQKKSSQT